MHLIRRAVRWLLTSYHRFRGSVLEVDGVKLQADRRLSRRMVERIWSGAHTRWERSLVHDALTKDDVVMELGGGIGLLAISCARKIGGERVHSFEADRSLEPVVRQNCRLNGVDPHFEFCMLGRSDGQATLHVGSDFWVSSVLPQAHHDRTMSVEVRSFDREVARIQPTFLVVDIEGAEEDLFRHANLSPFAKIMVEFHPRELGPERTDATRRAIHAAGFEERRQLHGRWYLYQRTGFAFSTSSSGNRPEAS